MPNIFKQFGEKATASFSEHFSRSIIRLTILYSLTLAIILGISGVICYSAFSRRIVHRFKGLPPVLITIDGPVIPLSNPTLPTSDQLRDDLINSLVLVNAYLLVLAIILSYWLAKKTLQPIKTAYEKQQRFLSDASHELRTPLTILQIDLENELLAAKTMSKESLESKLEEVHRMSKIINDILALSRMEHSQHTSPENNTIILADCIAVIKERFTSLAEKHGVTIELIEKTKQIKLSGDEVVLSHALTNLVQNAIVYNKKGGTVEIVLDETDTEVLVSIADTGVGVSNEDQQHIFDRFYRADKSRTRHSSGSGLGLSIVQSAVRRMGGTIAIESELEKGTTIRLSFPK